jgi:outer membrane protein
MYLGIGFLRLPSNVMKILSLLLILLLSTSVAAHEKHRWEAGVGVAALYVPHYLGSNQADSYVLPLPYAIYRGETIRADREGVRGAIYASEKLDLRFSLSGSLPVDSSRNDARRGMDDLDLLIEVGPTLQYQLYKSDRQLLRADWPVRAAFSFGSEFMRYQGWTSNPRLHHSLYHGPWTLTSTLGPVFSDSGYHGFFYDVDQQDVTADRPYYQASAGYTGARLSIGLKRRYGQFTMGALARYYNLNGAANEDSPLVVQTDYFSFGLYFAWLFNESQSLVQEF